MLHPLYCPTAHQVFQDVLGIENFTKSEEAFAADALFLAYQSGDAASIQKTVQVGLIFNTAAASAPLCCRSGRPACSTSQCCGPASVPAADQLLQTCSPSASWQAHAQQTAYVNSLAAHTPPPGAFTPACEPKRDNVVENICCGCLSHAI